MITEQEKRLYNIYLATNRSAKNKPFRLRQNFDDFEESEDYLYIKKIQRFLTQFPQINANKFFAAPYALHKDIDHVPLKFFATQKAIKAYTIYIKQLQEESPDSEHHIQFIKESLRFIGMFCIKNKITLDKYITHSNSVTYSWMKHIREHKVSIYSLFEYTKLFDIVRNTPKDELDLLLGNIITGLSGYKNRYDTSKNARRIVREGLNRIRGIVDKPKKEGI